MRRLVICVALIATAGCKCDGVMKIKPSVDVQPSRINFGAVANGGMSTRSLQLKAQNSTEVIISTLELQNSTTPGGAEGFTVKLDPITVAGLDMTNLPVTFHPTALQAYQANLVLTTNDEDHQTLKILLSGQGSKPIMKVTPDCDLGNGCAGTVVVSPPSIDFGSELYMRPTPIEVTKLPGVIITNEGEVELNLTRLEIIGTGAAAFRLEAMINAPLDPMDPGTRLPIRFKPVDETTTSYEADLVIESDDPDLPMVTVHLTGRLQPNLAPLVCANLIRVTPDNGCAVRDYDMPSLWTVMPSGGYDFRTSRPVEPRATVLFSSQMDSNPMHCTYDPEDGRTGLTYVWTVPVTPQGSQTFGMGMAATYSLTPIVEGDYEVDLAVRDMNGHLTTARMQFTVKRREDLIVRLDWAGFAGTDLDVHLVRPTSATAGSAFSGAFSFFNEGPNSKTSGDMNGYSSRRKTNTAGLDFEWGGIGSCDDPRLNIDDVGSGALIEDVSLNNPENDAKCDGGSCPYKVFVHYFNDTRLGAMTSCVADGGADCNDGESCSCATGLKCVAAPPADGGRPIGAGECRAAPQPVVKIYLKGSSTPAATIPVAPSEILLGSPCKMLYVADVNWPTQQQIGSLPDGGTPLATITDRSDAGFAEFGARQVGDLRQCAPDVTLTNWYSQTR